MANRPPLFRLPAYILFFGIFVDAFGGRRYSDVLLMKGNKYMIINSHTGQKVVTAVTDDDYPLNETGTPDAACNIDNDYFFFKGDRFWRLTGKRYYSASISTLFNTTFSSGINAALCSVEIDMSTRLAVQLVYLFKDNKVEKLHRLNSSIDLFQIVQTANLNIVPDAALALKVITYHSLNMLIPAYYPIVMSRDDVFLLNMEYPDQMTPLGNLAHNFKLSTDEELYFASNLAAAMSSSLSGSFIFGKT